jgi:hypothetical protein
VGGLNFREREKKKTETSRKKIENRRKKVKMKSKKYYFNDIGNSLGNLLWCIFI